MSMFVEKKSREIVGLFFHQVDSIVFDEKEKAWKSATQAALIMVDEIITVLEKCVDTDQGQYANLQRDTIIFWKEIKVNLERW